MKHKLLTLLSVGILGLTTISCDKYTDDVDINVKTDVLKYTVLVQAENAAGGFPEGLQISLSGDDAEYIYDGAGNKDLVMNGGLITLGVHPKHEPTESDPVQFTVKLSGPGYLDSSFPVTIYKGEFSTVKTAKVIKLSDAPSTVEVETETVALSADGTSSTPIVIETGATASTPAQTEVSVPANTHFQTAAGTPIVGNSLELRVITFNEDNSASSVSLFPGGSLIANDVTGPNGTATAAVLLPAGVAQINMSVDGQEVKKFSNPITITMDLNAEFKKVNSAAPIADGDKLSIYSYSESTGKWGYDKEGTVTMVNGKPKISFTTSHLTVFTAADKLDASDCSVPAAKLVFGASWLGNASEVYEYELRMDNQQGKLLKSGTVEVKNDSNLPINWKIDYAQTVMLIYSRSRELVAEVTLGNYACGSNTKVPVNIPKPATKVDQITLNLTVKCPKTGVVALPNFDLFYKPAGANSSSYKYLGKVVKGKIHTTTLTLAMNTPYAFKAVLGDLVKEVGPHMITEKDMSVTVAADGFTGAHAPDENRTILIEECAKRNL